MTSNVKLLPPAGWHTEGHLTDKSATTYSPVVRDRWLAKGWPVWPLYTADQVRACVLHHTAHLRYALDNAARSIKSMRGVMDSYAAEIEALRAEVRTLVHQNGEWQAHAERLAEALQLARDLVEYWAGYTSEHFQKKHNLEGDLALLDDALRDHEQEVGNWTCEMRPND